MLQKVKFGSSFFGLRRGRTQWTRNAHLVLLGYQDPDTWFVFNDRLVSGRVRDATPSLLPTHHPVARTEYLFNQIDGGWMAAYRLTYVGSLFVEGSVRFSRHFVVVEGMFNPADARFAALGLTALDPVMPLAVQVPARHLDAIRHIQSTWQPQTAVA